MNSIKNDYDVTITLPEAYRPQTAFTFSKKSLQHTAKFGHTAKNPGAFLKWTIHLIALQSQRIAEVDP